MAVRAGATIMGRRMFSGGEGPWEGDPQPEGWWGEQPPFGHPVFVLTRHPRRALQMKGGTVYNFVTDGIEAALEQARTVAGEKDVALGGGANVVKQYLAAALLDEIQIHLVPVLLGQGVLLFDQPDLSRVSFELINVIDSPTITHLRYRVVPPTPEDDH